MKTGIKIELNREKNKIIIFPRDVVKNLKQKEKMKNYSNNIFINKNNVFEEKKTRKKDVIIAHITHTYMLRKQKTET